MQLWPRSQYSRIGSFPVPRSGLRRMRATRTATTPCRVRNIRPSRLSPSELPTPACHDVCCIAVHVLRVVCIRTPAYLGLRMSYRPTTFKCRCHAHMLSFICMPTSLPLPSGDSVMLCLLHCLGTVDHVLAVSRNAYAAGSFSNSSQRCAHWA